MLAGSQRVMPLISLDCSQPVRVGWEEEQPERRLSRVQVRQCLLISSGTFWFLEVLAKNVTANLKGWCRIGVQKSTVHSKAMEI